MEQKLPEGLTMQFDSVVLDCLNAHGLALFYSKLLGCPISRDEAEFAAIRSADGVTIFFQTEPDYVPPVWPAEPGKQQMMAHLDFAVNDLEEGTKHALNCGATLASVQYLNRSRIFFDPSDHPFCLCCWD